MAFSCVSLRYIGSSNEPERERSESPAKLIRFFSFEVRTNVRSAITIPERSWKRFRDIFHEVCDKMETVSTEESGGEVKPAESPSGAAPAEPTVVKTEEK